MAEEVQKQKEDKINEGSEPVLSEVEGLDALKQNLSECEKQKEEYLAGWQRAKADFINYKKEEIERIAYLIKFSNEELISELINILDSFDIGLTIIKDEEIKKGVYLIKSQLEDILKKRGLVKININVGDAFNPKEQEAIGEESSEKPVNSVIEILSAGYILNGKVIRPTKVKVSKGQITSNQ